MEPRLMLASASWNPNTSTIEVVGDDTGGSGDDTLYGDADNVLYGYGRGNDSLNGGDGNDSLTGDGDYSNLIDPDPNSATYGQGLYGQDVLEGGPGTDLLKGGNDSDTYVFGGEATLGTDTVQDDSPGSSMDGRDTLTFKDLAPPSGVSGIVLVLTTTTTQVVSGPTNGPQLSLVLGSSVIENVIGSDHATRGNDSITGNTVANDLRGGGEFDTGNDTLYGGIGNDTLHGIAGHDRLWGASGNDSLIGGAGNDSMEGEAGDDWFEAQDNELDTLVGGIGTDGGFWDTGTITDLVTGVP